MGKSTAQMKSLFPIADYIKEDEENKNGAYCLPFSNDYDEYWEDAADQEQPLMENFELKAKLGSRFLIKT